MSSVTEELERLAALHKKDELSDEEFAAAKQRVLGDEATEGSDEEREFALLEARQLQELGTIEREQSNHPEALRCFQAALDIFCRHGDRIGEGRALATIGILYTDQCEYEKGIPHLLQAIDIHREVADRRSECTALGDLGTTYQAVGQTKRAIEFLNMALDIAREEGNQRIEGVYLGNLGIIFLTRGQFERSIELFTQAVVIAQKIGHKRSECINLGGLGNVWYAQRRYQRAIDLFTRALNLAREIGAKHIEGIYIGNLGDAFAWLQRLEEAEGAFREAIPICEDTFPVGAGAFRGSLALLLAQQDQLEEAQALLQTGETQVEPHKEEHAKFLGKKGQVCHLAGDADGARTSLEQARALAVELKVTDESEIGQAIQALEAVLSEG